MNRLRKYKTTWQNWRASRRDAAYRKRRVAAGMSAHPHTLSRQQMDEMAKQDGGIRFTTEIPIERFRATDSTVRLGSKPFTS